MAHQARATPEPPSWKGVVTHKRTIVIPLRLHPKELEHLNRQAALPAYLVRNSSAPLWQE